jgi:hypothetical protein
MDMFRDRFVQVPYGRSDVICGIYSSNNGEVNMSCIDTADIGLTLIFVFATIGFTKAMKDLFIACCCKRY